MGLEDPCHLRGPVQLVETQFPRFAGILGIRRRRHGDGARTPSKQGSPREVCGVGGRGRCRGRPSADPAPEALCAHPAAPHPAPAVALPRRGPLPGDPRAAPPWSARSAAATHAAALAIAAAAAAAMARALRPDVTSALRASHPRGEDVTALAARVEGAVEPGSPSPAGRARSRPGGGGAVRARGEPEGGAPLRGADDDLQLPPSWCPGSLEKPAAAAPLLLGARPAPLGLRRGPGCPGDLPALLPASPPSRFGGGGSGRPDATLGRSQRLENCVWTIRSRGPGRGGRRIGGTGDGDATRKRGHQMGPPWGSRGTHG